MDVPLPIDKLSSTSTANPGQTYVVLVATGSFNPPTYMHLRLFELARDALNAAGYCVIGGYISPVNDAYKKEGLISAEHCVQLCGLAARTSDFIMVDSWEVNIICRDFGVVCIRREGQDVEKIITNDEILSKHRANIKVVPELVPNQISSTRARECISRGLSIKYLTADEVIDYSKDNHLYLNSNEDNRGQDAL